LQGGSQMRGVAQMLGVHGNVVRGDRPLADTNAVDEPAVTQQEEAEVPRPGTIGRQRGERVHARIRNERFAEYKFDEALRMRCGVRVGDHQADVVANQPDVLVVSDLHEQPVDIASEGLLVVTIWWHDVAPLVPRLRIPVK